MINVGVVGSRNWKNKEMIFNILNVILKNYYDVCIVSGGAQGVDSFAVEYAKENKLLHKEFLPKLLEGYSKFDYTKAYYTRNQDIVDFSDILIAFVTKPIGGTWDTIRRAKKKNIEVIIIEDYYHIENI